VGASETTVDKILSASWLLDQPKEAIGPKTPKPCGEGPSTAVFFGAFSVGSADLRFCEQV
jgi:hypothetical protein